MTDDTSILPPYAGRQVAQTTISIRNAGDGLSKGMAIDPQVLTIGGTYYVTLECTLEAHDYKRLDKVPDMLVLDQVLKAGVAVLMDRDLVAAAIDEQRERILVAEEERKNLKRLPFADEGELGLAHARGDHAEERIDDCPVCRSEIDAEEKEAADEVAGVSPINKPRKRAAGKV